MLKRKLARNSEAASAAKSLEDAKQQRSITPTTSKHFVTPLWKHLYDLECALNVQLQLLKPPASITHIYNPVEYAAGLHCAYLEQFLDSPKRLIFVGMNPGPNGMGQTGIPFGNISTVRNAMKISGTVEQPPCIHSKRPVKGLQCTIEEPSGVRIWTLLQRLANGSLDTFARQCFVHNFCPLAFFDKNGKNVTPNELKGDYKMHVRDVCLRTLEQEIHLLQPEIVVAVGDYVFNCLKHATNIEAVKILKLPHPSPRSLNNQNWPAKAELMFEENDLLKYIRNEL